MRHIEPCSRQISWALITVHVSQSSISFGRGGGKLINLLGRGDKEPVPFQSAYASSKTWNPGLVLTDMITKVEAIAGYEERMKPFETITRMWGKPPAVPAARVVRLASSATDGKTGIEVQVLGFGIVIGGAVRELFRRMGGSMRRGGTCLRPHLYLKYQSRSNAARIAP